METQSKHDDKKANAVDTLRAASGPRGTAIGRDGRGVADGLGKDGRNGKRSTEQACADLQNAIASCDTRWAQEALDNGALRADPGLGSEGIGVDMFYAWWEDCRHDRTHPERLAEMARWLDRQGEPLAFFEHAEHNEQTHAWTLNKARVALAAGPLEKRSARLAMAADWRNMAMYRRWEPMAMKAILVAAGDWENDPDPGARVSRSELLDAMSIGLSEEGPVGIEALGLASGVFGIPIGADRWRMVARGFAKRGRARLGAVVGLCLSEMVDDKLPAEAAGMVLARACFEGNPTLAARAIELWDGAVDWLLPVQSSAWIGAALGKIAAEDHGERALSAWHLCRLGANYARDRSDRAFCEGLPDALLAVPESAKAALDHPNPYALAGSSLSSLRRLAKSHPGLFAPDEDGCVLAHAWARISGTDAFDACARLLDASDAIEGVEVEGELLRLSSMVGLKDRSGQSAHSILSARGRNPESSSAQCRFEAAWAKWEKRQIAKAGGPKPSARSKSSRL